MEISPQDPTIRKIFALVGSRKRKGYLRATTSVTLTGTYWDGGSRSTYTAIRLADMAIETAPQFNPPQFGGPASPPVVPLRQGYVIIEHGIFCGKPSEPTIYVHPSDFQFFLPQA